MTNVDQITEYVAPVGIGSVRFPTKFVQMFDLNEQDIITALTDYEKEPDFFDEVTELNNMESFWYLTPNSVPYEVRKVVNTVAPQIAEQVVAIGRSLPQEHKVDYVVPNPSNYNGRSLEGLSVEEVTQRLLDDNTFLVYAADANQVSSLGLPASVRGRVVRKIAEQVAPQFADELVNWRRNAEQAEQARVAKALAHQAAFSKNGILLNGKEYIVQIPSYYNGLDYFFEQAIWSPEEAVKFILSDEDFTEAIAGELGAVARENPELKAYFEAQPVSHWYTAAQNAAPQVAEQLAVDAVELYWNETRERQLYTRSLLSDKSDNERLNDVYAEIAPDIIGMHNHEDCSSCGHAQMHADHKAGLTPDATGYVFYHQQDIETLHMSIYFKYGAFTDKEGEEEEADQIAVATKFIAALKNHGFSPIWDGSPDRSVEVPFRWTPLLPEFKLSATAE
jgi:hypothetical protein